jgi:hypothetical protein
MRTRAEANRQRWAILGFAIAILVLSFLILKSTYYLYGRLSLCKTGMSGFF